MDTMKKREDDATSKETLHDIASRFGISPDELNLDLGPVGKLM